MHQCAGSVITQAAFFYFTSSFCGPNFPAQAQRHEDYCKHIRGRTAAKYENSSRVRTCASAVSGCFLHSSAAGTDHTLHAPQHPLKRLVGTVALEAPARPALCCACCPAAAHGAPAGAHSPAARFPAGACAGRQQHRCFLHHLQPVLLLLLGGPVELGLSAGARRGQTRLLLRMVGVMRAQLSVLGCHACVAVALR